MNIRQTSLLLVFIISIASCKKDNEENIYSSEITSQEWTDSLLVNPSSNAPLTAKYFHTTSENTKVELIINAKESTDKNFTHTFSGYSKNHEVDIIGLYPNHDNTVIINFYNQNGIIEETKTKVIKTDSLPPSMPDIEISTINETEMQEGWNLVSYRGNSNPNTPFIFDNSGKIRWYLDYSNNQRLMSLSYDVGIERLKNGNFYFGDKSTNSIYEVSIFGEIINEWNLSPYTFHHDVQERPNGNFLITATYDNSVHISGKPTIEDYVIEINRQSGSIINVWDLKESLDESRNVWINNLVSPAEIDWFHGNAVIEGHRQDQIIVSGRTQGLVKLTENNNPEWIMSTHNGWDTSRTGINLNQFLLQPLDAAGNPIIDTNVLYGHTNHPDFEWNWYQHAPFIMPNGNILLFDNGDNRNYDGNVKYSRAVEYEIDEHNMTIRQVWSYGKNRGSETYSRVVSDVDYLEEKNNVLFSPGFDVENNGKTGGKVVEIDYLTKNVVFEALISPPNSAFGLHRSERLNLYP